MIYLIIMAIIFIFAVSKLFRCIVFNLHNIGIYSVKDLFFYFKEKKWNDFDLYGIDMYVGMFGKGKTLSLVHTASSIYNRYGDSVCFLSNIHLQNIPYKSKSFHFFSLK